MMKRIVAAVMALVIVAGAGTYGSGTNYNNAPAVASAADYTEGTSGVLTYQKYADHVVITDCDESAENVEIPAEIENLPVTVIGEVAFGVCKKLKSVTIPDSVTEIQGGAFNGCPNLGKITIPDSVKSIGIAAFELCDSLAEITIPESVESIGVLAFHYCKSLKKITILNPECEIDNNPGTISNGYDKELYGYYYNGIICGYTNSTAQAYADQYYQFEPIDEFTSGTFEKLGYKKYADYIEISSCAFTAEGEVVIPAEIEGLPVTAIGESAFYGHGKITKVIMPDTITNIGHQAFYGSTSLEEIIISESLMSVGDHAFEYTKWLENKRAEDPLVIVNNILIDGSCCEGEVIIPSGVKSIGIYAFYSSQATSIILPDSLTKICECAFDCCYDLTEITIPDSVAEISWMAFSNCPDLTEITILNSECAINDSPRTISNGYDQTGYIHTHYYNGVIRGYENSTAQAYAEKYGCIFEALPAKYTEGTYESLTYKKYADHIEISGCDEEIKGELVIPDEIEELPVTVIGDSAFDTCFGLTSVTIPDSVTTICDSSFLWCRNLTEITIPDSVTSIGSRAFQWCESLTSISIPDSITEISDSAFYDCESLTEIIIPDSVTSIGYRTFEMCTSLTEITIPNSVTSIGDRAFAACLNLDEIKLSNNITEIGEAVFFNCTSLNKITIHSSVTKIGGNAFMNCENLTEITIPESVVSIGSECFSATGLNVITILNPDCEIYRFSDTISNGYEENDNAFTPYYNGVICGYENSTAQAYAEKYGYAFKALEKKKTEGTYESLTYKKYDDHVTITGCDESAISVDIPDKIEGIPVTGIDSFAFALHSNLVEVTIPDSVKSIGMGAFQDCTALTEITIPESVGIIGENAFSDCASLTSITILNQDCEIYNTMYTISNSHGETGGATYNGVIRGYPNSTARAYAGRWGYEFEWFTEAPEQTQYKKGDANCDGKVTVADATAILQYLGNSDKYPLSSQGKKNSDVDAAPGITVSDALTVQRLVAGLIEDIV